MFLPIDQPPKLEPTSVTGGIVRAWAGKYQALVDEPLHSCVAGYIYKVSCKEYEDALHSYEIGNYEVVRCTVSMKGRLVQGCTFRSVGSMDVN